LFLINHTTVRIPL